MFSVLKMFISPVPPADIHDEGNLRNRFLPTLRPLQADDILSVQVIV